MSFIKQHPFISAMFALLIGLPIAIVAGITIGVSIHMNSTTVTQTYTDGTRTVTITQPAPSPIPTLMPWQLEQHVEYGVRDALYNQNAPDDKRIQRIYFDTATNSLVINYNFDDGHILDSNSNTMNRIKSDSFAAFQIIYSSNVASSLHDVSLMYTAAMTTSANRYTVAQAGSVELMSDTEKRFSWYNLTADSAWSSYDIASFTPTLSNGY